MNSNGPRYRVDWDQLRQTRYQRQIDMGIIDPRWPLSPRPDDVPAWDSLSADAQDCFDPIMAVYAAMIDCIDQNVGRMVEGLRQRGMLDNTLRPSCPCKASAWPRRWRANRCSAANRSSGSMRATGAFA